MKRILKKILLYFLLFVVLAAGYLAYRIHARINPKPTITQSPTSIIGFNHVGITVLDLDKMIDFYQRATQFEVLDRFAVSQNASADQLYGEEGISYEKAVLKGPNMFLELVEFNQQEDSIISKMPPQGPGMTHTCYQSAASDSGYDKFKAAGVEMLTRGNGPVALGNYGVSYAYAYDPEGNMMELEQMSDFVIRLSIGQKWAKQNPLWMTQVAILSPEIERLTDFYHTVFEIEPYRVGLYKDNPAFGEVADLDSLSFKAAWFMLDGRGKKLELMEYQPPHATPHTNYQRKPTDLGYTYSLEVLDIQKEYGRLKELGVKFVSAPQQLEHYWMVYAHDIDGNVFSLRQATDPKFSLAQF